MPKEQVPGKPQTRRNSPEEKAAAVRMVGTLRAELGTEHGTVQRVATQLGHGVEPVRQWVKQADIDDGHVAGGSTAEAREDRRAHFGRTLVRKGPQRRPDAVKGAHGHRPRRSDATLGT